jgi:acyl-CoA reductase-like NAD-dependent aldehyde dehydrogenase
MQEEIFGPVLTVLVYPHEEYEKYLSIADDCAYALTAALYINGVNGETLM